MAESFAILQNRGGCINDWLDVSLAPESDRTLRGERQKLDRSEDEPGLGFLDGL
jgi:hypothetical protein